MSQQFNIDNSQGVVYSSKKNFNQKVQVANIKGIWTLSKKVIN
jgi:hypothetical protein